MKNTNFAPIPAIGGLIRASLAPRHGQPFDMSALLAAKPADLTVRAIGEPVLTPDLAQANLVIGPPVAGSFVRWPQVGRDDRLLIPNDIFLQQGYRVAYKPGEPWTLYVAGCNGLRGLSAQCATPLYKVSTCQYGRLQTRLQELGHVRYGSIFNCKGGKAVDATGWDSWSPVHLHSMRGLLPNSPVSLIDRGIVVWLPANMRPEDFEAAYDAEIRLAALNLWIRSADGLRLCKRHSLDPAIFERFTRYTFDTGSSISEAKEIAIFRPTTDVDRLIQIAETIILRHLGLVR